MVQVRENFKSSYESLNCELCNLHIDSQKNLLICKKLDDGNSLVTTAPAYEDLFSSDAEKQVKIALLLREKFQRRKAITKKKPWCTKIEKPPKKTGWTDSVLVLYHVLLLWTEIYDDDDFVF